MSRLEMPKSSLSAGGEWGEGNSGTCLSFSPCAVLQSVLAFISIPGLFTECPEIEIHTLAPSGLHHYPPSPLRSVLPTRCQKHTIDAHIFSAAYEDIQDVIDLISKQTSPQSDAIPCSHLGLVDRL